MTVSRRDTREIHWTALFGHGAELPANKAQPRVYAAYLSFVYMGLGSCSVGVLSAHGDVMCCV